MGDLLRIDVEGPLGVLRLTRPEKRNAVNERLITELGRFFADPPAEVAAAVLLAEGAHFCAGIDLEQQHRRTTFETMEHSRLWHRVLDTVEHGRVPLVAALKGAVIGGGLEIALAAHVRVADPTTFYALPEGRLGIFVGGGASVRVGRVLGPDRLREMMLTGRRLTAEQGQALGFSHELADDADARARALALEVAQNAPLANRMMLAALPRIGEMGRGEGFWAEAMTAAVIQTTEDAVEGLSAFLEKRPPDFQGR